MNCITCGTANSVDAKHCHNCGTLLVIQQEAPSNVQQEVASATEAPLSNPAGFPPTQESAQQPFAGGQQVPLQSGHSGQYVPPTATQPSGTMLHVKNYFTYVLEILKKPNDQALAQNKDSIIFGLVNIITFALLFGLTTLLIFATYADVTLFGSGYSISVFSTFVKPLIIAIIMLAIGGCTAYLLLLLHKKQTSFLDLISKWSAFMVLPATVMPLVFLAALAHLYTLAMGLFAIAVILIFASSASLVRHYKLGDQGKLDSTYTLSIYFLVNAFLIYLVMNNIVSTVTSYISGYFGSLFN